MNFLNIKTPVKMEFVIGEHRDEFEKNVLELYMENIAQGAGFWGVIPSSDVIAANVKPSFTLAGLLAHGTGDPSYYIKETHGKLLPDFEQMWAAANLRELEQEAPGNVIHAEHGIHKDVISVLDYHNICFMFMVGIDVDNPLGTGMQGMKHSPIKEVW